MNLKVSAPSGSTSNTDLIVKLADVVFLAITAKKPSNFRLITSISNLLPLIWLLKIIIELLPEDELFYSLEVM